tara:strand:- start:49 stop:522 length:474 start_codon:yes stop_codon:yes gene_type:complete
LIVSEEYPWSKLLREYFMYCAIGCINVTIFFVLYWLFSTYNTWTDYVETIGWAISFIISSAQAYILHRWLTFESSSEIRSSLSRMMIVYGLLWIISTFTFGLMVEVLDWDEWQSWAINTVSFGFFTFLGLRFYAFPIMDGRVTRKERLDTFREQRRA